MFIPESRVCTQRMQLYKGYEPIVWFGAWLHFTAYPCLIFTGLAQHGGFYHHFILFIQKKSRNHLNFDALKRVSQLFITKDSKKSNAKGQEKISTLKNNSESKGRIQLTEPNSNQLIKRHLGKVEVF